MRPWTRGCCFDCIQVAGSDFLLSETFVTVALVNRLVYGNKNEQPLFQHVFNDNKVEGVPVNFPTSPLIWRDLVACSDFLASPYALSWWNWVCESMVSRPWGRGLAMTEVRRCLKKCGNGMKWYEMGISENGLCTLEMAIFRGKIISWWECLLLRAVKLKNQIFRSCECSRRIGWKKLQGLRLHLVKTIQQIGLK